MIPQHLFPERSFIRLRRKAEVAAKPEKTSANDLAGVIFKGRKKEGLCENGPGCGGMF